MKHSGRHGRAAPVINVTPLVDVVLVLLIIFMVVVPMMEANPKVVLPLFSNPDQEAKSKTDPYTLSVVSSGDIYLDEKKVDVSHLEEVLRAANRASPARRLVLRADKGVRYKKMRPLFKTCQTIGFPGISLRVSVAESAAR